MDSLSSPITVATSNQGSNNKDVKGKGKLIILPPDWSSDEEDELRSSCSDDESEGGLAKKRNSSQLTEKEAKKNAMKRLRKARRDKTTKAPYISPAKKKARLDGKSAKASPVKYDSEIDELASQQSMKSERFSLGKMPWESDSDDEDNPRKKVSEPIYEEKVKATNEFDDLPPALPPPEKVWTRKARPPSRRDLFDASQRPDPPKQSSPPPARTRDDPNELPDLVLPSSANMKTSDPPSTPQDRELEARCRSPTIEELPKLDVGHSDEVSPGDSDLAHLSEPKNSAENIVKSDIESAQQPEKTPELHYAVPEPDYCGDTSYGDGDLSLEFEDMELAAMRPFFTPEPEPEQPPPVGLPLGPSATAELDALIADAEFEAAQEAARQAEEESAMAEEAIQSSSTSLNAPGKIEANMPTKQLIRDQMSSSTMPSPKQENMVKDPVQIAQISKTTTTSNLPDAKGKGKARQDSADSPLVKGHREEVTQIEDSDQELWHDFDDIMPLEDEVVPRQSSNKGSRRDMFSPDVPAISKVPGSSSASSARAGGSSSKLPSSEEESQPCSFCGMIVRIDFHLSLQDHALKLNPTVSHKLAPNACRSLPSCPRGSSRKSRG